MTEVQDPVATLPTLTAYDDAGRTESVTLLAQTHVPDEEWERVKPHFSDQEIADLTLLIIAINGWNRIAVTFRKMPA